MIWGSPINSFVWLRSPWRPFCNWKYIKQKRLSTADLKAVAVVAVVVVVVETNRFSKTFFSLFFLFHHFPLFPKNPLSAREPNVTRELGGEPFHAVDQGHGPEGFVDLCQGDQRQPSDENNLPTREFETVTLDDEILRYRTKQQLSVRRSHKWRHN